MPDFTIEGDAAGIRGRASTLRAHGEDFVATGDALAAISTEGWTGRAAQRFNDKFETEPQRWRDAGDGFVRAAGALEDFAAALDSAQQRAAWAEAEYARGERETESARSAYDADVSQARQEVANAAAGGQFMTLTILPFRDPGQAIRDAALRELESAKADLEATAQQCAAQVRAGCEAAPAKRRWYQKVGDNFVEFFSGAGEALMDLAGMVAFIGNPGLWMLNDMITDLQSGMTEEEIAAKNQLRVEDAQAIFTAFREDPAGFGLELGKAILDWDTWKDNPARAAGRLLPDAVIAVLTAGGGAAARGARGVDGAIDGALDASAGLRRLDDVGAARRLDDGADVRHVDLDDLPDWHRPGGEVDPRAQDLVPEGFDPYGGLSRQEFYDRHFDPSTGWDYPANDGFLGERYPNALDPAERPVIDRFGNPSGQYASPAGTPYDQRALPPTSLTNEYHQYRVERPLPESVTQGEIAPAFEMPGGGTQYLFDKPIQWYIDNGYLTEVGP